MANSKALRAKSASISSVKCRAPIILEDECAEKSESAEMLFSHSVIRSSSVSTLSHSGTLGTRRDVRVIILRLYSSHLFQITRVSPFHSNTFEVPVWIFDYTDLKSCLCIYLFDYFSEGHFCGLQ